MLGRAMSRFELPEAAVYVVGGTDVEVVSVQTDTVVRTVGQSAQY